MKKPTAKLVDKSGNIVNIGDTVTDFRGKTSIVDSIDPPRHSGSTGRVYVSIGVDNFVQGFYPAVFGLTIVTQEQ